MWQEPSDPERCSDWPQRLSQRGIGKLRAYLKGNFGVIVANSCFSGRYSRRCRQTTDVGKEQGPDKSPSWIWCCFQDRLVWIHRRPKFFQLLSMGTKMVGPGTSEIVLDLATVALVDGASVFIFLVIFQKVDTFHFPLGTNGLLIPTGGVALGSPTICNAVVPDSEERIQDLLLPDVSSTSNVLSNIVFYFNEGVTSYTDRSKMIRTMAGGVEVVTPSGKVTESMCLL